MSRSRWTERINLPGNSLAIRQLSHRSAPSHRSVSDARGHNLVACAGGLLAIAVSLLLTACTGELGATDGGVPLGKPPSPLTGQVSLASMPSQPVANAELALVTSGVRYTGRTDAAGTYVFPSVSQGPATLVVSPPTGTNLAPQTLQITIANDATRAVSAELASQDQYDKASSIAVSPPSVSLKVGDRILVSASVQGTEIAAGTRASIVVSGGVGEISPDGTFTATHSGSGSIIAAFGSLNASIPVLVR